VPLGNRLAGEKIRRAHQQPLVPADPGGCV
jgi:hypothetical protein